MTFNLRRFASLTRKYVAVALAGVCASTTLFAQEPIAPEKPTGTALLRPYKSSFIPPAHLTNTIRIQDLVRAGRLYLTAQDAIALALENNIDLEIARYNPLIGEWDVERAQAGGALPGVPSSASQAGSVASGQGVAGSQAAAGVSANGNNQNSNNGTNVTISQIGPVTPTLDPVFQSTNTFSHRSSPQANLVQSGVLNLITNTRNYTTSINQGFLTGGQATFTYRDSYLNENAPTDLLNPSSGTVGQLTLQHNFLSGFGVAVNSRTITVAKANLNADQLSFKGEVISVVADVLDAYYSLVAEYQDLTAKQTAVNVAQQFVQNNQRQVQIGTMAPLDVTTAEAQLASAQQDLVVSQTALDQQQVQLKNLISRNGLADPLLVTAVIVPLDTIVVPEHDDLPPLQQLIATALNNRTDIAAQKIAFSNAQISNLGTENAILPQLTGTATFTSQGLSGTQRIVVIPSVSRKGTVTSPNRPGLVACPSNVAPPGNLCELPDPYFVGSIGTALGETFRHNFPGERASVYFNTPLRNRTAQADFAIDQLTLRQTELQDRKDVNQLTVDVSNQLVGLQQARVRYLAAVHNRILEQQLLEAEQKRFALGASTTFLVVEQQRDLAAAQSTEVASLVSYSSARVAFDATLGTTLDQNHVNLQDALSGRVPRPSALPASLPSPP